MCVSFAKTKRNPEAFHNNPRRQATNQHAMAGNYELLLKSTCRKVELTNDKWCLAMHNSSTCELTIVFVVNLPFPLFYFAPGYIVVTKNEVNFGPKVEQHDYADLLKKHWPLLLVVVISALVVTLTPIIGYVPFDESGRNYSPITNWTLIPF